MLNILFYFDLSKNCSVLILSIPEVTVIFQFLSSKYSDLSMHVCRWWSTTCSIPPQSLP